MPWIVWVRNTPKKADALGVKPVATFFSMSASTASWSAALSFTNGAFFEDCA